MEVALIALLLIGAILVVERIITPRDEPDVHVDHQSGWCAYNVPNQRIEELDWTFTLGNSGGHAASVILAFFFGPQNATARKYYAPAQWSQLEELRLGGVWYGDCPAGRPGLSVRIVQVTPA